MANDAEHDDATAGGPDVAGIVAHTHAEGDHDELVEAFEHGHEPHEGPVLTTPPGPVARALHLLRLTIERITGFFGGISQVLVWVVFFVGLFNVVARYMSDWLNEDYIIAEFVEGQSMLFAFLALFGFGYGMREGVNPRVDFWWAEFSDRRKAAIDLVFHVVFLLPFCWVAIKVLWTPTLRSFGMNLDGSWDTWKVWEIWEQSSDAGGITRAPSRGVILVAFVLLFAQTVAEVIKTGFILAGRKDLGGIVETEAPLRVE